MLNLSFVKTFVTLVETGSYIETARKLGIAQPTVTQQISKLEATLGATLIHRSHQSCSPTPHGQKVLPYAHSLLRSSEKFVAAAEGSHLSIGCSGNISTYFIASELKGFLAQETKHFSWNILTAKNPDLGDLLENGEIDLAAMEWADERPGFSVKPWRREPLVVVVPPDHTFAGRKKISVAQLFELELIGGERGSGTGTLLTQAFGKRAQNLKITKTLHSTEAVKNAVRAGLGSSIILKGAVRDEVEAGQLASLNIEGVDLVKTFHLAFPSKLPIATLPSRLAMFLTDCTKNLEQSADQA